MRGKIPQNPEYSFPTLGFLSVLEVCLIATALNFPADLKERVQTPAPVSGLSLNLHFYRIVKWSQ